MKLYQNIRLRFLFLLLFLLLYSLVYYFNTNYRNFNIQEELNSNISRLKLHYDITNEHHRRDALSVDKVMSNLDIISKIMKEAYGASRQKQSYLREKLYNNFLFNYQAMRQRGYLQFQFVFPNNISFLRVHKPQKFDDNLSNIRYSFKYTNTIQKPISGFEAGKTAHGFRNVFPIFDKNRSYLGCYEISHSPESIQHNLSNINKIHSHFLVNKNIFSSKMWDREYKVLDYLDSIENSDYKFVILDKVNYKKRNFTENYIIKPHREEIKIKMGLSKEFAFYTEFNNSATVVAFLPINNIRGDTKAYLVSYSTSTHLLNSLKNYRLFNILIFITLLILLILLYKHIIYKNSLELKTKEQNQLLSLFDKGDTTIFKLVNNSSWSVSYVSDNAKLLTGYTKGEFEAGIIDYKSIIDPRDIDDVSKIVKHVVANHINLFKHESYRIITKRGDIKWLLNTSQIIKDSSGQVTHFLGFVTDITKIKNQELALISSKKTLRELTKNLQKEVKIKVDENIVKDKLLQEQTKLAAMGEMIGAIAHQWRQPLNALSIHIQNLDDDYAEGLIDEQFIEEYINRQTDIIEFMSHTIDDFRNFFRVDKLKQEFSIKEAIKNTVVIQDAQFKNSNIDVNIIGDDFKTTTLESEFKQVILNILSNAKDAILEKNIKNGKITIELEKDTITISDNAGGIPIDILDRIFEPYFTTKEQGKGTGIGLYMSKMIIQRNMNGSLSAYNSSKGASFIIKLSL